MKRAEKWVIVALLFAALYQWHELSELRDRVEVANINATNAINRAMRVSEELERRE